MTKSEALKWLNNERGWATCYVTVCLDNRRPVSIPITSKAATKAIQESLDGELKVSIVNNELYLN